MEQPESETHGTDSPAPNSPDARAAAELAKIRAETRKLERDEKIFPYVQGLEVLKALGAFAAIIAIVLTFRSQQVTFALQQRQEERAAQQRRDDAVAALSKQFVESPTPRARLTAAVAFDRYFRDTAYAANVLGLFLSAIREEDDEEVRQAVRGIITRSPDSATLDALATQNRGIVAQVDHLLGPGWQFGSLLNSVLAASTLQSNNAARIDSIMRTRLPLLLRDLEWNVATLVDAMNARGHVERLNLERIALVGRFAVRESGSTFTPARITGVRFEDVTFRGANLSAVLFDNATFVRTSFDTALLASTYFIRSRIDSGSSFNGIRVHAADVIKNVEANLTGSDGHHLLVPIRFDSSQINVRRFALMPPNLSLGTLGYTEAPSDVFGALPVFAGRPPDAVAMAVMRRSTWRVEGRDTVATVFQWLARRFPVDTLPLRGTSAGLSPLVLTVPLRAQVR